MKALKKIEPIWILVVVVVIAIGIWYWKIGRFTDLFSPDGKKEDKPDTNSTTPSNNNYSSASNCNITRSNWIHYKDLVLRKGSPHRCSVKLLQKTLGVTIDGIFGPETEAAAEPYSKAGLISRTITLGDLNQQLNKQIYNSLS